MQSLISLTPRLPAMNEQARALVSDYTQQMLEKPQYPIDTKHLFHQGAYYRTVTYPAGSMTASTLMKVATTLVVNGDVLVYDGSPKPLHLVGHHVIAAEAGRQSFFMAIAETSMTLVHATKATSVDEVERELTDDFAKLQSRKEQI